MKIKWFIIGLITGGVLITAWMIPRNHQNYNAAVILDAEKDYWQSIACQERKFNECK